ADPAKDVLAPPPAEAVGRRLAAGLLRRVARLPAARPGPPQGGRPAVPLPGQPVRLPDGRAVLDALLLPDAGAALGVGAPAPRRAAGLRHPPRDAGLAHHAAANPGASGRR